MNEQAGSGLLLIYTDASYCGPQPGHSSWGAVITGPNLKPQEYGGAFKKPCPCSATAEARGVANALHIASAAGHLKRGVQATVHVDCHGLLAMIAPPTGSKKSRRREARDDELQRAIRHIREALADIPAQISFEWVRGHESLETGGDHARFNRRADKVARSHNSGIAENKRRARARRKAARNGA